jgi:RNA polymerase sigma-70 factor (ECF subfamily)
VNQTIRTIGDNQSEQELIKAAQKNPDEFHHLFNRYYDLIFNYSLRRTCHVQLAEDVTANTFLKALNQIKKYRWKGIPFSSWLYRIATNEINLAHRKSKRLTPLTTEITAHLKDDTKTDSALLEAEETLAKNEKFIHIYNALKKLKMKYQTVLTLRYFEEKSIKEIADILEMSENTVKTHIRRGLIYLREKI